MESITGSFKFKFFVLLLCLGILNSCNNVFMVLIMAFDEYIEMQSSFAEESGIEISSNKIAKIVLQCNFLLDNAR